MMAFLARRWFLLILAGGVSLALARPDLFLVWTSFLDPRLVVGVSLFLMAWTLPARHLGQELSRPWAALWALVLSYGLLPAAAWLVGQFLLLDYRIGIQIMAAVPCTLASAVLWTRLAGGNEATALLVILLSTASSWLVTTAWLGLATGTSLAGDELFPMMRLLLLTLVVPVTLGQIGRSLRVLAHTADRFRLGISVVAQLLVLAIILKTAAAVGLKIQKGNAVLEIGPLLAAALACIGLHLGTLGAGLVSSRRLGFPRPQQVAVAFAASQKTLPVALVLFENYFQSQYPLAIMPLLLYHVGQLILDTIVAEMIRWRDESDAWRAPERKPDVEYSRQTPDTSG
jgi:solute carrier family 10 (sodium/bile acid cotransporter), member 7